MSKFKLTQTAAEVQDILNNSLQKPTGLAKTKLVGVGVNGQENIEIGDNLTLANGKLAATGSLPSTITFDEEGNRTVGKNLNVDGDIYSKDLKTYDDKTGKLPVIYSWTNPSIKAIGACYHDDPNKITSPAFIDYFNPNWDITLNGCYSNGMSKNNGFTVKVACAFAFCNFVLRNTAKKVVVSATFLTNDQIDNFNSGTKLPKLLAAFKKELGDRAFG